MLYSPGTEEDNDVTGVIVLHFVHRFKFSVADDIGS
jgi:hypothetical protein